jgi:hypothetical protein
MIECLLEWLQTGFRNDYAIAVERAKCCAATVRMRKAPNKTKGRPEECEVAMHVCVEKIFCNAPSPYAI